MSNRAFIALIVVVLGAFVIFGMVTKKPEKKVVLTGVTSSKNQGEKHIGVGQPHKPYATELPSSGDHYADASSPAQWGVYVQEVQPEIFLHNLEHGGVVVAYKPDLPQEQIKKLQQLFGSSSPDKKFNPGKFILTPRAENKHPIELASWTRNYNLNTYDEAKIKQFYFENVSNKRAPESYAGPTNKPINQALGG